MRVTRKLLQVRWNVVDVNVNIMVELEVVMLLSN